MCQSIENSNLKFLDINIGILVSMKQRYGHFLKCDNAFYFNHTMGGLPMFCCSHYVSCLMSYVSRFLS